MTYWLAGTYTHDMGGSALGILSLRGTSAGGLELGGVAVAADSPSYLAYDGSTVYAVAEGTGRVASYARDDAGLTFITDASSGGSAPCHLGVYGSTIVACNYVDGVVGVLESQPLSPEHSLTLVQSLSAEGGGPHAVQDGPHAHSSVQLADGTVLTADLGADRVHIHGLENGRLERRSSFALAPGTGPRDFALLPSGDLLLLAELSAELLLLRWNGSLSVVDRVNLPGAVPGDHAAGISVSNDSRHAFVALRGSNRIAVVTLGDSELSAVNSVSSGGDWPRHHVIDGDVLHVANQLSSTIASFRIDERGIPQLLETTSVPSPTFLLRVVS
ncbi:MAG: lactonase family protein [Microbacteriaceae bacterium]